MIFSGDEDFGDDVTSGLDHQDEVCQHCNDYPCQCLSGQEADDFEETYRK